MKSLAILAIAIVMLLGQLFFMAALGGLVLLVSLAGSALTLVALPVLWLKGQRRPANRLLTAWGIYVAVYLTISTGITLAGAVREPRLPIGKEVCADAGCFAVDRVEKAETGVQTTYTLYWHLSSNDKETVRHFPGKGLELFLFDERGRKFALPQDADRNPLDVDLPAGGTVRQVMTFRVPADASTLFLTAKYRPFTFQSLLPGELSLVPHRPGQMIRIQ
jgi:hypothetical protein